MALLPGDVLRSPALLQQCRIRYILDAPGGEFTTEQAVGLDAGYGEIPFAATVLQNDTLEDAVVLTLDVLTDPAPHGGSPFSMLVIIYTGQTPNMLVAFLPFRGTYALSTGEQFRFTLQTILPFSQA